MQHFLNMVESQHSPNMVELPYFEQFYFSEIVIFVSIELDTLAPLTSVKKMIETLTHHTPFLLLYNKEDVGLDQNIIIVLCD